jgi:hypothetical protein
MVFNLREGRDEIVHFGSSLQHMVRDVQGLG